MVFAVGLVVSDLTASGWTLSCSCSHRVKRQAVVWSVMSALILVSFSLVVMLKETQQDAGTVLASVAAVFIFIINKALVALSNALSNWAHHQTYGAWI